MDTTNTQDSTNISGQLNSGCVSDFFTEYGIFIHHGNLNQNKMEKEQVKIDIPEGKKPKLTTLDNGVHVEWVEKEKTWEQYVLAYRSTIFASQSVLLTNAEPDRWPKMFKFGLLQYIADDLNEEKIDWENGEQKKLELLYDHSFGKIS